MITGLVLHERALRAIGVRESVLLNVENICAGGAGKSSLRDAPSME